MPRLTSSQLSAAVKAPARQPQPKPYAWSREWAWNEVGGDDASAANLPPLLLLSFTSTR